MSEINSQALREAAEQAMPDNWGFDADLFHELVTPSIVLELLELLDEREQNLIRCRYFENRTQSETAKELGMTQVQVSRLEKKILLCLRKNLGSCDS